MKSILLARDAQVPAHTHTLTTTNTHKATIWLQIRFLFGVFKVNE